MSIGKSIRGALSYNEQKLSAGKASLLLGANFSCDVDRLSLTEKLNRFNKLTDLNKRAKTNCLHISLNFSPKEELTDELMATIARDYMERIGFAGQPYLVYRHKDAGHPHLHIVTTNIQQNRKAIPLYRIGALRSEPARKAIEEEYGLIKAQDQSREQAQQLEKPVPEILQYARTETKRQISNVVRSVVGSYNFTNFDEFKAILRQYNIVAVPTSKAGKKKQGLVYSFVNKKGERIGAPINASAIFSSPTLPNISKKFARNEARKEDLRDLSMRTINSLLLASKDEKGFMLRLHINKWGCSVKLNDQGLVDSVLFINHRTKVVYEDRELGWSADAIVRHLDRHRQLNGPEPMMKPLELGLPSLLPIFPTHTEDLIDILLQPEYTGPDVSAEFFKKKKKRTGR